MIMNKSLKIWLMGGYTTLLILWSVSSIVKWMLPTSTTTIINWNDQTYVCSFHN